MARSSVVIARLVPSQRNSRPCARDSFTGQPATRRLEAGGPRGPAGAWDPRLIFRKAERCAVMYPSGHSTRTERASERGDFRSVFFGCRVHSVSMGLSLFWLVTTGELPPC